MRMYVDRGIGPIKKEIHILCHIFFQYDCPIYLNSCHCNINTYVFLILYSTSFHAVENTGMYSKMPHCMILQLNSFLPCLRNGLLNMYLVPLLLPLVFVMMPDYWQVTDELVRKLLFTLTIFNNFIHATNWLNRFTAHYINFFTQS